MKNKIFILLLFIFASFPYGDDCENCFNPVANAGLEGNYFLGCNSSSYTEVCLDGSLSSDYEGETLMYNWEIDQISMIFAENQGDLVSTVNYDLVYSLIEEQMDLSSFVVDSSGVVAPGPKGYDSSPCFILPDLQGNQNHFEHIDKYVFKLKVSDGQYISDPDFVTIYVNHNNTAPALAELPDTDYSLKINESFILDLSSLYDNTGNGLTSYGYNMLNVDLSDFNAFDIQNLGSYVYQLTLNEPSLSEGSHLKSIFIDDGCNSTSLDLNIAVIGNEPPFSIPGPRQNVWAGDSFTLDASLSYDPDGDLFTYEWVVPPAFSDQMIDQSINDEVLTFVTQSGLESEYSFELNVYQGSGSSNDYSIPNNGNELFFSEYYEPSSNLPKYIEIYNSEINSIDLSDYEIWYVEDVSDWNGSNLASSVVPDNKLLFNACSYMDESGEEIFTSSINGVEILTAEDCCLQFANGYEDGIPFNEGEGNLGLCVSLDASLQIVDTFDQASGECFLSGNTWLIPYFDDSSSDYAGQCKAVDFNNSSTVISESISAGNWRSSCSSAIDSDDVIQIGAEDLQALSAFVFSSKNDEKFLNDNYVVWDEIGHNGKASYALIKKNQDNQDGIIIDILGDLNGNLNSAWLSEPLKDSRLIRKEKVYEGNINWSSSLGLSSENSEWYIYKESNDLSSLKTAGEHYCGACDNVVKINTLINNPPVPVIDTQNFIASLGNQFSVFGDSSYDPDGAEIYYYWSADDGMGLGCADGLSSSEEECCLANSIECSNGSSTSERSCCEASFGVWNLSEEGIIQDLCDSSCCYVEQNPWTESSWDSNSFCMDSISNNEEACCLNNGGEWNVINADLNVYECIDSVGYWNGERCEISSFSDNPASCCEYQRLVNDEELQGGIWDDSMSVCFGGSAFYKSNGQCFGGDENSAWNHISNQRSENSSFSILNTLGNCNGEYISERDCCVQNPINGYCATGNGNSNEECCENNPVVSHCSNDNPDNPQYSEQYCCESSGGMWDPNSPDLEGNPGGYCFGEPTEKWIETYWDSTSSMCKNPSDNYNWVSTYWDYDLGSCINDSGAWSSNSFLPITLYVTDGYNVSSSILQINVVETNLAPTAVAFIEKMNLTEDEQYFTLCENHLYDNAEDCENNAFEWKGVTYEGYQVFLNGSSSFDQTDTGSLDYRWEAPAGIDLSSEFTANTSFVVDDYIAPLVYDKLDFNGERACLYSSTYPVQYEQGRDCSTGYCSNDNSQACDFNSDCCDCESEDDVQACLDDCVDICLDYIKEEDCCVQNNGNWMEQDKTCSWDDNDIEISWNNCYLDLTFNLIVTDGGYIGSDLNQPSTDMESVHVRVKPKMPIVGEIYSYYDNSSSSISMDELEYLLLYSSENDIDNSFTFDPEGNHSLKYTWSISSVDGYPDLSKSGYCSSCDGLEFDDCSLLSHCQWNDDDSMNEFCSIKDCASSNDCDEFYCQLSESGDVCANVDILPPCIMSECEFNGSECLLNNDGIEVCCIPSLDSNGNLSCIDNGLSCDLGSLCYENLPEDCASFNQSADCNSSISCSWNQNSEICSKITSKENIIDNVNDMSLCVDDKSMIYVSSSKGFGDFVDYGVTLNVEDVDEINSYFKNSENQSTIVRVAATYPIANAGDDMVYTFGYDQIQLNGYMSHDPQADKIDYSYWGSNCSDGVSANESYCDENNGIWYPGGVWYTKENLGLLAYYDDSDWPTSSILELLPGYDFNWRYDLMGNCVNDNSFCFDDSDCGDSVCEESSYKDDYLFNGKLYKNYIDGVPYGEMDTKSIMPFFEAPELICDGTTGILDVDAGICNPVRLFFELTVSDNNNLNSELKVSFKDSVFIDIVPNTAPKAIVNEDFRVHVGAQEVYLDALESFDETPLNELDYIWFTDSDVVLNDSNSVKSYFDVPTDLCSDNISLNEKDCCLNNNGLWLNDQTCEDSSASWVSEKEVNFMVFVCDGISDNCNQAAISEISEAFNAGTPQDAVLEVQECLKTCDNDFVTVTYSAYSYPEQPRLYSKTDHEKVHLFWNEVAEESIDDLSLYSDFQGYKIYRSEDYGQTWGSPIYRNGELKGWVPYYQLDMSFEDDSLYCLYEYSRDCPDSDKRFESIAGSVNWYPGYDWQNLGYNSGIENSFVDSNVVDGIDYTYTITAYDRGYKPDTLQYGSYGKLEILNGLNVWNKDVWKPEAPKYVLTEQVEADSFNFYKMDLPIKKSSIDNQTRLIYEIEIPPNWFSDGIVTQNQVDEGISIYNTNNLWPTSNIDGYPLKWSLETDFGNSIDDINYQEATPGYNSSNITSPIGDTLNQFVSLDCRSVGNGDVLYEIVDESSLTDEIIKLEIQAYEESNDIFENYKTQNPCLYAYNVIEGEINSNNRLEWIADSLKSTSYHVDYSSGEFVLSQYDIDEIYEFSNLTWYESSVPPTSFPFSYDFSLDDILSLPGVFIDTLNAKLVVPNYILACHPITNIDDLDHEINWTDYFKGITMKFDNAPGEIPETSVARTKDISHAYKDTLDADNIFESAVDFWRDIDVEENPNLLDLFDQSITFSPPNAPGIEITLEDIFGHINLLYFDQDSFDKKAAYRYQVELIDPIFSAPDTALFSTTDINSGSQQACGRDFSTLVPFKVKNLKTGKYVEFSHTDNGKWNGDINAVDFGFPTAGIVETHPGYKDCSWTPGEWISFYSDTTLVGNQEVSEKTFKMELIYNRETVALMRPDYCGFESIEDYENIKFKDYAPRFELNTRYDADDCVSHEGVIWHATQSVDDNNFNIPNVYYEVGGVNLNPWKPLYPWNDGDEIIIEPQSWYADGDYWIADMSMLGRVNDIRENDLSSINVVPNPYIVSSLFNEDVNENRLRFTRLPSKCKIDIFTINGEHVKTIYHESVDNNADGNEWWDLKNSKGRKVAPGLYIYNVETDNGLSKIGKFAIVR